MIDLSLEFKEEGNILIRAAVVRGRSQEIRESFDEFLIDQLSNGWGENYYGDKSYYNESGEPYFISFIAAPHQTLF